MLNIPDIEEFSINSFENDSLNLRKIIKTLFLPISIILFIFLFALFLTSYFCQNIREIFISNGFKQIFLHNNFSMKPIYNQSYISNEKYHKNEETIFRDEFIKELSNINYEGIWFNKDSYSQIGLMYSHFSINKNIISDKLNFIIKITEGSYIDKWIAFYNEIPINHLKIYGNNRNNYLLFEGEFNSNIETGEMFNRNNLYSNCKTNLSLNFTVNKNNSINFKENIIGILKSNCKNYSKQYEIKIKMKTKNSNREFKQVKIYSILTTIICMLMVLNTIIVQYKLNNSEVIANGICFFTIYINIISNSYGCICHFFLTINYPIYRYYFILPTISFFINFSITDLRLLYSIWRLKYIKLLNNPNIVKRKLISLYFKFYLGMFLSLLFVTKFFFNKLYIILGTILIWFPQIIYNIFYNNQISLPWSYIILTSIYRLYIPLYFRINSNNFLLISPDIPFSIFIIFLIIFQLYILFCQSIKGNLFFLPKKDRVNAFDFYKNKDEILNLNPNSYNIICVICLYPLFKEENEDFSKENCFIHYINIYIGILKDLKQKIISFFEFGKINFNYEKKKYFMTNCKHIFHVQCLEKWFQKKMKCPNCRAEININI